MAASRCCPRLYDGEGSNDEVPFGIRPHGFWTGPLRFVPPSLTTTQGWLPAGGQPLPDGVRDPLGSSMEFQCWFSLPFYLGEASRPLSCRDVLVLAHVGLLRGHPPRKK